MNLRKSLLLLLSLLLVAALAACSDKEEENGAEETPDTEEPEDSEGEEPVDEGEWFPLVDEEEDMHIFYLRQPQNDDAGNDWDDLYIWNHYADLTNVNVTWEGYLLDALEEQRNLSLQGGEMPDAYWLADFPVADLERYGSEGVFIPLQDLIEEHAPNLTAIMDEDPAIRAGITFPDGNIYSMPSIVDQDFLSVSLGARMWINTDHVDEYFDGKMPETTDEFYDYLVAIKDAAPAGADTIPYGGTAAHELIEWATGPFGVMNRGPANANFDLGEDGNIRFYANTEEYKEMLRYLNKLWEEELIDQNLFENDWGHFTANAGPEGGEIYSAYVFYDPEDFFNLPEGQWVGLGALEGPNGVTAYNKVAPSIWSLSNFVITEENANPEAAVKWMDYFYSDEGAELYYMGVEGETFEVVDGETDYVDDFYREDDEGNKTLDELAVLEKLAWVGSINGILSADYFLGGESKAPSMDAAERLEPYVPEEIWPRFTFDGDESRVIQAQGQDVANVSDEYRDQFIVGDKDIDADWDEYLDALNRSGLDEVIEVYQAAFERYEEAK